MDDSTLFPEWFHQDFVPQVQKSLGEKSRAILLLDNCSAYPKESELVSDDSEIFAHFLPANVTSLIQPMDQGMLQAVKMKYKKKLLRRLIIEDDVGGSIIDFIKSINMKIVVELATESWNEVYSTIIRKSWQEIIPLTSSSSDITPSNFLATVSEATYTLYLETSLLIFLSRTRQGAYAWKDQNGYMQMTPKLKNNIRLC